MDDAKESMGTTIDRLDSLAHGLMMAMPADFHLKMMRSSLPEVVRDLKKHYVAVTGGNPWDLRD